MIEFILLVVLGALTGVMAGLLGIGGGLIVVPGLVFLLHWTSLPESIIMHVAAGTSLCIMIFTAWVSARAHHRHGHVDMSVFFTMLPTVLVGTVLGALLATEIPGRWLGMIFGVFLLLNGIKLLYAKSKKSSTHPTTHSANWMRFLGALVGFPSGLLGVGGGFFTVPLLLHCGLEIQKAIGTSAILTLPISMIGTAVFSVLGIHQVHYEGVIGYIYWPAVLVVVPVSMLLAPVGARWSTVLPTVVLRRAFACFMLLVALQMLWKFV